MDCVRNKLISLLTQAISREKIVCGSRNIQDVFKPNNSSFSMLIEDVKVEAAAQTQDSVIVIPALATLIGR